MRTITLNQENIVDLSVGIRKENVNLAYVAYDNKRVSIFMSPKDALQLLNDLKERCLQGKVVEITSYGQEIIDKSIAIVSCNIIQGRFDNEVVVENENGDKYTLFSYYPDELHFSAHEFIGLSGYSGMELFHQKDIAYLKRSLS